MKNTDKKNNFYFTIHRFMTRDLGLRGAALVVYAIIYSFSYDGIGTFFGTRDVLADYAGISISTVGKILNDLTKSGLIHTANGKNFEHKEYQTNLELIKDYSQILPAAQPKITCAATENKTRSYQNSSAPQPNFTHYNKYNNGNNNKYIYNTDMSMKKEKKDLSLINKLGFDPDEAFRVALQRSEDEWAKANEE